MFVVLIGPKGAGKSHIGRILEKHLGVFFFYVEPLWMDYYAKCQASGCSPTIPEGIASVHPLIRKALLEHKHVCVETTGASAEILHDLLALEVSSKTILARVSAPLDLCLERIANRDVTNQIPMDADSIRKVYALSVALELRADVELSNQGLSDPEIISRFQRAMGLSTGGPEHAT
jgi:dephospho-CoA kinase